MAKSRVGARVQYCAHNAYFVADIHTLGEYNIVVGNVKPNGGLDLIFPSDEVRHGFTKPTHHLTDMPPGGYFNDRRGIFVVPKSQVIEL